MTARRVDVEQTVLVAAMRYALGRRTAMPSLIAAALIEHRDALPEWTRALVVREITDAIQQGRAGDRCDVNTWHRVLVAYDATGA